MSKSLRSIHLSKPVVFKVNSRDASVQKEAVSHEVTFVCRFNSFYTLLSVLVFLFLASLSTLRPLKKNLGRCFQRPFNIFCDFGSAKLLFDCHEMLLFF